MPNPWLSLAFLPASICQCRSLTFQNGEPVEASQQHCLCHAPQFANLQHMLGLELSAMHKSPSRCRRKGDREADEDIQRSMKDGGSRSPRPRWWHYIDPATPEPEVQSLLALSALFSSALLQLPWSLSETQEYKTQRIGRESADVSGAGQVAQDWLNYC